MVPFVYDDGGRAAAGFKGTTGDCTVRAIAIAAELPYRTVYDRLNVLAAANVPRGGKRSYARTGVPMKVIHLFMKELGWEWVPTMQIGSGCKVHVRADELPPGRVVLRLTRHLSAFVDGVLRDTHDCSRGGTRCVYGYWKFPDLEKDLV